LDCFLEFSRPFSYSMGNLTIQTASRICIILLMINLGDYMAAIYPLPKTAETATEMALGRSFGTGGTFPRIRRQGLFPHLI